MIFSLGSGIDMSSCACCDDMRAGCCLLAPLEAFADHHLLYLIFSSFFCFCCFGVIVLLFWVCVLMSWASLLDWMVLSIWSLFRSLSCVCVLLVG